MSLSVLQRTPDEIPIEIKSRAKAKARRLPHPPSLLV